MATLKLVPAEEYSYTPWQDQIAANDNTCPNGDQCGTPSHSNSHLKPSRYSAPVTPSVGVGFVRTWRSELALPSHSRKFPLEALRAERS